MTDRLLVGERAADLPIFVTPTSFIPPFLGTMTTEPPAPTDNLLLESVLQTALDGIVLCRAVRVGGEIIDFYVERYNNRVLELTGFSHEQLRGNSMLTLDPLGRASGIFDTYKQVVETGLPVHVEHYFAGADVWMAQSLARFGDGVLGAWSDRTALRQVEQARGRETGLIQSILDNTQTGIAVMDAVRDDAGRVVDFRFTHLNQGAEHITRRSRQELLGHLYSEAWPEARTNGVLDWHIGVAQTGVPAKQDGVNLPVGDYDGWYNIRIRPLGEGVIATFSDVTALKRAELANQQQADLLRSVLDGSSNAVVAFRAVRDPETGRIVDFRYVAQNEANRRQFGRTDDEVIGHTMLEYFPNVVPTGLFDRYVRVVETGEAQRFEQEYNHDLLKGWFELSATKWGDGFVLTRVDVTASHNQRRQLEQANRALLSANDNLRQFAYVASHDLQEPLRKIQAFGGMLEEQFAPVLGEPGADVIRRMQSAAGRMSDLIRDVLAYSRISTHREPFGPVALDALLTDLRHQLDSDLRATNATLRVEPLPVVLGERAQLRQLFDNLLTNALKFRPTDRPPAIQVTSRRLPAAPQPSDDRPAELDDQTAYYEISVADNGIGFEAHHAERIFGVFQRLHSRQQYDGTGVGLAICRRVAENHYGTIVANGQPGQGATFRVYLPA